MRATRAVLTTQTYVRDDLSPHRPRLSDGRASPMPRRPRLVCGNDRMRWLRCISRRRDRTRPGPPPPPICPATTADRLPADPRCAARRAGRSTETRRETGLGRHGGDGAGGRERGVARRERRGGGPRCRVESWTSALVGADGQINTRNEIQKPIAIRRVRCSVPYPSTDRTTISLAFHAAQSMPHSAAGARRGPDLSRLGSLTAVSRVT